MKRLLILGAGTAGTMMANRLRRKMPAGEWQVTIIDQEQTHYYQPGFLFLPFDIYSADDVTRPKRGRRGELLRGRIASTAATDGWKGGRLVVHVCEMPIKCPIAPLEFAFLAAWWLTKRGLRDKTELVYVTPLSGAFTKPIASRVLGHLLEEKGIRVITDFSIGSLDNDQHKIVSWDQQEVDYDLLVTVPTNMGDPAMERSGLGDELNFVATDHHTLLSKQHANIFVIGDATDLPTSKAGSVAHFEGEVLTENILHYVKGEPLESNFDGHANCFIESGHGKAVLLDFNYDLEPVEGTYPLPVFGPFSLLRETRPNHWGKLGFKWIYWNALLKGLPLPGIGHRMSWAGKQIPAEAQKASTY